MAMARRETPLVIWAPTPVLDWVKATLQLTALHLPYDLDLRSTDDTDEIEWDDTLSFQTRALRHRVPTHAFEIRARRQKRVLDYDALDSAGVPRGPLWGEIQRGRPVEINGTTINPDQVSTVTTTSVKAICGGDNADPEVLKPYASGLDLLIHEATYTQPALDKVGPEVMHSSAAQVARFAAETGIPNLILTHFSPRHHGTMDELAAEVQANYAGQFYLAHDQDTYQLSPTPSGPKLTGEVHQ
jgi:ribonuclease Z